ncbi:glycerophosphodiester phosphodiesterase family protein [Roseibium salinum]|uniref:Glycerophosphodiester phosphodiesterase family protein n=1 Tax=Roseibium salinum TaxID=1604349 RepID=A0ABT3R198_9HYPH|nr:glycerophosphodiester phosphodiesterase family protein [Roseibium sp. DSM 29163]MCX2722998.1 glycerophosphodiester phosphodiesterase family protein [Roseibium sp. DSM 29163]
MRHAVIVCHRGACLSAPENTLASLAGAIDMGAEVVEFDVRPSRDGVLYVMHDATVDRTTDGTGRFADMTSDEIDTLDAGSWFSPEFAGERVPRLNTFLDACRGRIVAYAEIKEGDPAEVRDLLAVRGMLKEAWTFSFDQAIRAATRAKVPDFRRMVLFEHVGSVARAVAHEARIIEFNEHNLTEELAAEARQAGLITQMFYAGDDRSVFERAVRSGIEQMNIDHVETFRAVERELATPT